MHLNELISLIISDNCTPIYKFHTSMNKAQRDACNDMHIDIFRVDFESVEKFFDIFGIFWISTFRFFFISRHLHSIYKSFPAQPLFILEIGRWSNRAVWSIGGVPVVEIQKFIHHFVALKKLCRYRP